MEEMLHKYRKRYKGDQLTESGLEYVVKQKYKYGEQSLFHIVSVSAEITHDNDYYKETLYRYVGTKQHISGRNTYDRHQIGDDYKRNCADAITAKEHQHKYRKSHSVPKCCIKIPKTKTEYYIYDRIQRHGRKKDTQYYKEFC